VIEALGAGIVDEGGDAVDFLAMAVAFDHRPAHFRVGLPVDAGDGDPIGPYDYKRRHHHAMPEVQVHDVAFECRMSIMMQGRPLPNCLPTYSGLRQPVKRIVGPVEAPAAADKGLE